MLPTAVAHHQTVPRGEDARRERPHGRAQPQPAQHPPGQAARPGPRGRWRSSPGPSPAPTPRRTAATGSPAAAGREAALARPASRPGASTGTRPAGTSSRAGRRPRARDAGTRRARGGRRRPATRSGCRSCSAPGSRPSTATKAASTRPSPMSQLTGLRRRRGRARGSGRAPRLYSAAPSRLRRRLPVTALGSGMPDRESTTDDAPRRGIGRQIAGHHGDRPDLQADSGIRRSMDSAAPGSGQISGCSTTGPTRSRSTARGASTRTRRTPTTRRATSTPCGRSGPCARSSAPRAWPRTSPTA